MRWNIHKTPASHAFAFSHIRGIIVNVRGNGTLTMMPQLGAVDRLPRDWGHPNTPSVTSSGMRKYSTVLAKAKEFGGMMQ